MVEDIVLGSFLLAYNSTLLALKMKYVELNEQMKENIQKTGLYHITSEENAKKILESGYIRPSGILTSLGAKKTFFFAGIPNIDLIRENIAASSEQFEWTAIQVNPSKEDLSNYRIRAYDDNSIIFKGQCNLEKDKVKKVNLVLDLNQDGKLFIREKTPEEMEKGYEPSEELKQKFKVSKNPLVTTTRNLTKAYLKKPIQLLSKLIAAGKRKKENLDLNKPIIEEKNANDEGKDFIEKYKVAEDIKPIELCNNDNHVQTKEMDER